MRIELHTVDAFTDQPFRGNPAAVCILTPEQDSALDDQWRQNLALEMNLSETAFVTRCADQPSPDESHWNLRWFTPAAEVDLCGHATLASAHTLYERADVDPTDTIVFHTRSSPLTITRSPNGAITMNFPTTPVTPGSDATPPDGLFDMLSAAPDRTTYLGFTGHEHLIVLDNRDTLTRLTPEFGRLRTLGMVCVNCIAPADDSDDADYCTRYFAPSFNIDEDPVTGSAHCSSAPYFAARLGRNELIARQISPRGGTLHLRVDGDRVHITGRAITILRGQLAAAAAEAHQPALAR